MIVSKGRSGSKKTAVDDSVAVTNVADCEQNGSRLRTTGKHCVIQVSLVSIFRLSWLSVMDRRKSAPTLPGGRRQTTLLDNFYRPVQLLL